MLTFHIAITPVFSRPYCLQILKLSRIKTMLLFFLFVCFCFLKLDFKVPVRLVELVSV